MSAALAYVQSADLTGLGQAHTLHRLAVRPLRPALRSGHLPRLAVEEKAATPQSTGWERPHTPANDNHYLHLVDAAPSGTLTNHSRSPALFPPDRRRRPHGTKTEGGRALVMSYDSKNRLVSHTDTGGPNRTLGYDSRGNVTQLGGLFFSYDRSDQPTYISGTASGTYRYDGNMKRVKSIVDGKTIYNVYNKSGTLVHIDQVTDGKATDYVGKFVRIENNTPTYLHMDHLGSANTGTSQNGTVAWRQQHAPFGEELNTLPVNNDLAGYTGHIKDSATGLNYMQARYYDPLIGRFLSIDPVGFSPDAPYMFNRFTYVNNDPVNLIDPFGLKAWLISRPLGGGIPANHMFVLVVDDKTGQITRFSYGPQGNPILNPGKLVSVTGSGNTTDEGDQYYTDLFLSNPESAMSEGVSASVINASDQAVINAGNAMNALLGTPKNPGAAAPNYSIIPNDSIRPDPMKPSGNHMATSATGNSNGAAYGVTNTAVNSENPRGTQPIPKGTRNPGWGQTGFCRGSRIGNLGSGSIC